MATITFETPVLDKTYKEGNEKLTTILENITQAKESATSAKESATSAKESATSAKEAYTNADSVATQLTEYLKTKESLTAPAVDETLLIGGAAADSKVVGKNIKKLNNDLNDMNKFLKEQEYDTRLATNLDFIDGYYTSSLKTEGNNAYYRSTQNLIPLQDLNMIISGDIPLNAIYTLAAYDSNQNYLRMRLTNTAILSNNITIRVADITAEYNDIAFVRVLVTVIDSTPTPIARFDNSIEIHSNNTNVASKVVQLSENLLNLSNETGIARVVTFLNSSIYANGKYIKSDGTLGNAAAHCVISFPITYGKFDLLFNVPKDTGVLLGVIKDKSGQVVKTLDRQYTNYGNICRSVNLEDGTYTVYLNWFNKNTVNDYYDSVSVKTHAASNTYFRKQYFHSVRKPFDFKGKKAIFIGDSITRGATSGTTAIDSIYPSLFCQKVGMTYTNVAVSGSGFTKADSKYQIITQLQNAPKDTDYVFIAGGVNDYLDAVDLDKFKTAVQTAISYTLNNFNGEIIYITPINTAKSSENKYGFKQDLLDYSNAITEILMQNNIDMRISIVQGWMFGFPTEDSSEERIAAMFGDKLHPSELGYKSLYVSGLLNALC